MILLVQFKELLPRPRPAPSLTEGERKGARSGIKVLNLEGPIRDRSGLSDQLIHAVFIEDASAIGILV